MWWYIVSRSNYLCSCLFVIYLGAFDIILRKWFWTIWSFLWLVFAAFIHMRQAYNNRGLSIVLYIISAEAYGKGLDMYNNGFNCISWILAWAILASMCCFQLSLVSKSSPKYRIGLLGESKLCCCLELEGLGEYKV